MGQGKMVLILGGGVGGIIAARELRKRLPRPHRVVLVDRERKHLFAPSLLWLMVGKREAEAIQRPLNGLERKGIEVRFGEVEEIDPTNRRVRIGGEAVDADYLIVSLGAELVPERVPGLQEAGHNLYTLPGAEGIRDTLRALRNGKIVVLTAAPAYKCPAAPYEAAFLIDSFLRKNRRREAVGISVYAAESGPMGTAGPEVSAAVRQMLASKGISYHPDHQVKTVNAGGKRIEFINETTAEFDLLAYVPPHVAPQAVLRSGLAGESGWIEVDRHTLETRFPGVYAIGDVVSIPLKMGKPLPKAGVFAHGQAEVVARNISAIIASRSPLERFTGHGECFIETGDGKAGFGGGDFYAEPNPIVKLRPPGRSLHLAKVLFEKSWLTFKV